MGAQSHRPTLVAFGVLVLLAILAPYSGPFLLRLLMKALVLGILAMSLDLLLGYTGLPSLGQAAYLGVGAYLTELRRTRVGPFTIEQAVPAERLSRETLMDHLVVDL